MILAGLVWLAFVGGALLFCVMTAAAIGRGRSADNSLGNVVLSWLDAPASSSTETQIFTVRPGDDAGSIGQRLEDAQLIRDGLAFRVLATYYGASSSLKAGDYSLRPNLPVSEIIDSLRAGRSDASGSVASRGVTIPEGWQLGQIRAALEAQAGLSEADLTAALGADYSEFAFLKDRPAGASLEGYLFPATYSVGPHPSAPDLIRQMLQAFNRQVSPDFRQRLQASGLNLNEAVTLASIVEREAVRADERPLIAGVYLNRLRRGMLLQADPTVQYALAKLPGPLGSSGVWKAPLTREDLQVDSAYNTYRHPGLPPGPIASPGRSSLEAVANPTQTDFLYFVAKGDGSHQFAKTFEEHQRNIANGG